MKLSQKLCLLVTTCLVLVMLLCTVLLLHETKNQLLSDIVHDAQTTHSDTAGRLRQETSLHTPSADLQNVQEQVLHYILQDTQFEHLTLMGPRGVIYSDCPFSPADYLEIQVNAVQVTAQTSYDGTHYFLVGSEVLTHLSSQPYRLYTYTDITGLYDTLAQLAMKFALLSLTGCFVGVLLIYTVLKLSLRPLNALRLASSRIALGQYHERIACDGHDEVAELAQSFNQMAESVEQKIAELTQAAQQQRLFASAVSHEFKTPITAIALQVDSLQNLYLTQAQQTACLDRIADQCTWMEAMLQKLLRLLRMKESCQLSPTPMMDVLDAVNCSCAEALARQNILLLVDAEPMMLRADGDLLRAALINLVQNAAKASKPGGRIWIRAHDRTIQVADEGCGMSAQQLAHVTEPFYMGDASRTKTGGNLGLGLALVQEMADCHHARLEITSQQGKGTSVKIIFP